MIDITQKPEIEYDDSFNGLLDIVWRSPDGKESFSLVVQDGSLIGVRSRLDPPRSAAWKIELPKGFVRIDATAVST